MWKPETKANWTAGPCERSQGSWRLLTPPEHVLPLQQLHDGRLRGGHQDDAAVLSAAHQAALRRDVDAGRHLATQTHN